VCLEFLNFIKNKAEKYKVKEPRCIHWSQAEDSIWENVMNKHALPLINFVWLDLLTIFKEEPIVINGCMSFSLKDVATAMYNHGFINTSWKVSNGIIIDGASAMIAAQKANVEASKNNTSMKEIAIIKDVIKYNEVDVKVLYEILLYLRANMIFKLYNPKSIHLKSIHSSIHSGTRSIHSSIHSRRKRKLSVNTSTPIKKRKIEITSQ
jgi:hypothetical protein